jgi:hypothetical protein
MSDISEMSDLISVGSNTSYDEIDILINGKKEATATQYKTLYKRLLKVFQNGLAHEKQEDIIKAVNEMKAKNGNELGASMKYNLLLIPILIKNKYTYEVDLLIAEREKSKKTKDEKFVENCVIQNNSNVGYKEFSLYMENLKQQIKKEKYINSERIQIYLINYLMKEFAVRNQDVNLYITADEDQLQDKNRNYIFIKKGQIDYVRNVYKTVGAYGVKTHTIKDKFVIELANKMANKYLLGFDAPIKASSLSSYILRRTFNNLGEGKIYKLLVQEAQASANPLGEVDRISKMRGSSMSCATLNYNLNAGL